MEPTIVIKSAEFIGSAVKPAQYPRHELPELAFAGRSNVGKSSLINCLLQRKKLVRTSRTPGRTQTINFFGINQTFCFVDLPGYGFARVPEAVRASWRPMVESYLTTRRQLCGVVQILDLRHPPTADDLQLWNWLQSRGVPAVAVLTKADKLKRSQWPEHARQIVLVLGLPLGGGVLFSALTREGRDVLWQRIVSLLPADVALPVQPPPPSR
ncbi:MAG TPA: YihA family ribosome biogenesis GTP-binding protein [Syntrophobacteraceae bacterium]|nr:YihA family ribosome biogenesis GTP-binding protein [Syntrophobacteraceae bacterium]